MTEKLFTGMFNHNQNKKIADIQTLLVLKFVCMPILSTQNFMGAQNLWNFRVSGSQNVLDTKKCVGTQNLKFVAFQLLWILKNMWVSKICWF